MTSGVRAGPTLAEKIASVGTSPIPMGEGKQYIVALMIPDLDDLRVWRRRVEFGGETHASIALMKYVAC